MILGNTSKIDIGSKVVFRCLPCNIVGVGLGYYEYPIPVVGVVIEIINRRTPYSEQKSYRVCYNKNVVELGENLIEGVFVCD